MTDPCFEFPAYVVVKEVSVYILAIFIYQTDLVAKLKWLMSLSPIEEPNDQWIETYWIKLINFYP